MSDSDPRRWKALAVGLISSFMTLLDVSIVNVALPSIERGLHASPADLQWVVAGYALTFGLVLVPSGRLGDRFGRRGVFLIGVATFTLGSLAAGLAPAPAVLVAARLVQGVGGGILNPQVTALIQELFRGAERGRAFGLRGAVIGVSTAIGPVVGGALIQLFGTDTGWRWIFFVNLPIGVVALPLAWRLIPSGRAEPGPRDLDPVGIALLGAGVLGVLLPLVQERVWHWPGKWGLVVVGLLAIVGFVRWERRYARRGKAPVLDLSLFRVASYRAGLSVALAYFSGFTGILFVLTLFLQTGAGYSALLAGATVTPFVMGSVVGSSIGGRLIGSRGRPLVVVGLAMVTGGLLLAVWLIGFTGATGSVGWWLVGPLAVCGVGSGLVISPNQTLTLDEVPVGEAGSAGGAMTTAQRVGTAVGIAAAGAVYFGLVHGAGQAPAVRIALLVCAGLTAIALAVGIGDAVAGRSRTGADRDE